MLTLETVQENETQKLLWDCEIQTDHLIWVRRPDLVYLKKKQQTNKQTNKQTYRIVVDQRLRSKESEKRDKCQDLKRYGI